MSLASEQREQTRFDVNRAKAFKDLEGREGYKLLMEIVEVWLDADREAALAVCVSNEQMIAQQALKGRIDAFKQVLRVVPATIASMEGIQTPAEPEEGK